jgi:hypothetical protein
MPSRAKWEGVGEKVTRSIEEILSEGVRIWGDDNPSLSRIISCIGVIYGDICRQERSGSPNNHELKKEFGNLIVSSIRWCHDLGFSVDECIKLAIKCQEGFIKR